MSPTKRQIEVLQAQGRYGENQGSIMSRLGITTKAMHKSNTLVYQDFIKSLDKILEYYPIFENRLTRDGEEIRRKLLLLNRKIRESIKEE